MRLDVRAVDPDGKLIKEWRDPSPSSITELDNGLLKVSMILEASDIEGQIAALQIIMDGHLVARSSLPWQRVVTDRVVVILWSFCLR